MRVINVDRNGKEFDPASYRISADTPGSEIIAREFKRVAEEIRKKG